MRISKKHIGKPVILEFDDHATFSQTIRCRAIGWISEVTSDKIVLVWWDVLASDNDLRMNNIETCSIVRSAIVNVIFLK